MHRRQTPLTKEGYAKVQAEFAQLRIDRVDAVEHLKRAREMGDLSENGYYKSSRAKLSSIDRRLNELQYLLRYGKIITRQKSDIVSLGCMVSLQHAGDITTYHLVGEYEANPSQGRISDVSPLGRLLLGKKVNEQVTVTAPKGTVTYTIIAIKEP